jgi:hypothetical protein
VTKHRSAMGIAAARKANGQTQVCFNGFAVVPFGTVGNTQRTSSMDKDIKLPRGFIERTLSAGFLLCILPVLGWTCYAVKSNTPEGIAEWALTIVALEFLSMMIGYCVLVFIWCLLSPRWIPNVLNKGMRHFFPLTMLMLLGVILMLVVSIAIGTNP